MRSLCWLDRADNPGIDWRYSARVHFQSIDLLTTLKDSATTVLFGIQLDGSWTDFAFFYSHFGSNLRVFITGVSSGIGRVMAGQFVQAGYEVWGVARREQQLVELAKELDSPDFRFSVCDITDEVAVHNVYHDMSAAGFLPTLFILNAAVDIEESAPGLSSENTKNTLRTNLEGALIWVDLFINQCLHRKQGQFIAVSSLFAHWPDSSSPAYASSKAGLSMAFRSLRMRYRKQGIRFKMIYLGPVQTGINPRFADGSEKAAPPWIASPESVSRYIIKSVSRRSHSLFYPWYVFILIRFFGWLPDTWFESLTQSFKR